MMLLDSMITFSAPPMRRWMSGIASPSLPCCVRTQMDRVAPATRKRDVSLSPVVSFSSLIALKWSSMVAQSQGLPSAEQMPWPNCVILSAVQLNSGRAAINPATTLVFPTLRECPPITTSAMGLFSQFWQGLERTYPRSMCRAFNLGHNVLKLTCDFLEALGVALFRRHHGAGGGDHDTGRPTRL